jgi:hypothetical protein
MTTYTSKDKRFIITTYEPLTAEEQVALMDLLENEPDKTFTLLKRMGFETIDMHGKYGAT